MLRYLIIGGLTFAGDLLLLILLHRGMHLPLALATGLAFGFAAAANFALNRRLTFNSAGLALPAARYLTLLGLNLLIAAILVPALSHGLGIDYRLAKMATSAAAALWNYAAYRRWAFA